MERYCYEPGTIEWEDDLMDGFYIFDRTHGNTDDAFIAFAVNVDRAEAIVDALNEHDKGTS